MSKKAWLPADIILGPKAGAMILPIKMGNMKGGLSHKIKARTV